MATIWIQHVDGTVESLTATQGEDAYHVVLGGAPSHTLVTDPELATKTKFMFASTTEARVMSFLVTEMNEKSIMTRTIRATQYSDFFYANDDDTPSED